MQLINNRILAITLPISLLIAFHSSAQSVEWELNTSNVGIGTGDPQAKLHVVDDSQVQLLVEKTDASAVGDQFLLELRNASNAKVRFAITSNASGAKNTWTFDNTPLLDTFGISKVGTGQNEFLVKSNGDGTFRGRSFATNHVNISSRATKTDFSEVDLQDILSRLSSLPVSQWRYRSERASERHIGPVAEDFHAIFNLGDGKTISTVDTSGVAFAAIQALKHEKDIEVERLKIENDELRALILEKEAQQLVRIEQLELMIVQLLGKKALAL